MVESLMFPVDMGFKSQLNHSLLDVQIPHGLLWTSICQSFKPHKNREVYLKKQRFSQVQDMALVSTESSGCTQMDLFKTKGRFYSLDLIKFVALFLEKKNIHIES